MFFAKNTLICRLFLELTLIFATGPEDCQKLMQSFNFAIFVLKLSPERSPMNIIDSKYQN